MSLLVGSGLELESLYMQLEESETEFLSNKEIKRWLLKVTVWSSLLKFRMKT